MSNDFLARMHGTPATEMGLLLMLAHHLTLHQCLLPIDIERCFGLVGAASKEDRNACERVLANYFVITELGRKPLPGVLILPGGLRLSPAMDVTRASRERHARSDKDGVTAGVTGKERQRLYRRRVEELHAQAVRLGLSPRKHTSLSDLQELIDGVTQRNASVTPASLPALQASRARADLPEYQIQEEQRESARYVTPNVTPNPDLPLANGNGSHLDVDASASHYGRAALAMKAAGLAQVNPSHPKFRALVDAGASQELADATRELPGRSFAYVLATVEGRRREAAARAAIPPKEGSRLEDWVGPNVAAMLRGQP